MLWLSWDLVLGDPSVIKQVITGLYLKYRPGGRARYGPISRICPSRCPQAEIKPSDAIKPLDEVFMMRWNAMGPQRGIENAQANLQFPKHIGMNFMDFTGAFSLSAPLLRFKVGHCL